MEHKRAETAMHERERSFGLTVGPMCAFLAGMSAWRGHTTLAAGIGLVAVGLWVLALIRPSLLRLPSALWWRLAHGLGWVNSRVLLSALFVLILTPVAVVLRCAGWDPLRIRKSPRGSGWVPSPERHQDPKHYERMY